MRPCLYPGCSALVDGGRCDEHQIVYKDPDRRSIYASRRWRGVRRTVLKEQPWCAIVGCVNLTTDVDHIVPLRVILETGGDPYDRANLQGLCASHHASKTASEVWHKKAGA